MTTCAESPHAQAERVQWMAAYQAMPGTLKLESGRRLDVGLRARQGLRMTLEGGTHQQRELHALVLAEDLPSTEILDGSGRTRTVTFTHVETGLTYRISPESGSIATSPHGIYHILHARQKEA